VKTILFAIITLVASNQAIAEAVETSFRADALARAEAVEIGERSDVHAANLDPAKEAAIRKLLEQQGIKDTFERVVSQIVENAGPQVSANLPPGKYREKLVKLFVARLKKKISSDEILNLAVGAYDRHFTKSEIDGLVSFYGTQLGRKAISVRNEVLAETESGVERLGNRWGKDAMAEVLEENPDLSREMQAAGSADSKR